MAHQAFADQEPVRACRFQPGAVGRAADTAFGYDEGALGR